MGVKSQGSERTGKYISFSGDTTQRQEHKQQSKQQSMELDRAVLGKQVIIVVAYGSDAIKYIGQVRGMTQFWVYLVDNLGEMHIINKAFIIEYVLPQTQSQSQSTQGSQGTQNARGGGDAR